MIRTLARALRLPVAPPPPPASLGVRDGRLTSCPPSPNCVSSQADRGDAEHWVAPIAGAGDRAATMGAAIAALRLEPGARMVVEEDGYLRAECETLLMRYVDDLELLWDDTTRALHVRSASRIGRSDLGANRARVERLRRRIATV